MIDVFYHSFDNHREVVLSVLAHSARIGLFEIYMIKSSLLFPSFLGKRIYIVLPDFHSILGLAVFFSFVVDS